MTARGPLAGKLEAYDAARTRVSWKFRAEDNFGQYAMMYYTATFRRADGQLDVYARPGSFDPYRRFGRCKVSPAVPKALR